LHNRNQYTVLRVCYKPTPKTVNRRTHNNTLNSKLVNLLTSALFFHSLSYRWTRFSSLITLSRPSLTSRPKIANRSFYHSAPVLWNILPSYIHQVVRHDIPFPISNSPVFNLSTSLFFENWKPISFTLPFLLSLYSSRPSQDWYLRYWPSFVFSPYIHFAIIHRHYHSRQFSCFFDL